MTVKPYTKNSLDHCTDRAVYVRDSRKGGCELARGHSDGEILLGQAAPVVADLQLEGVRTSR